MQNSPIPAIIVLIFLLAGCHSEDHATERHAEVAEIGKHVMPFDLERSTHVFEKAENGGLQQVFSDDGDVEQIGFIREHLSMQAGKFSDGDFHDPAMIHGHDMPGLHDLAMRATELSITYSEIENGGQIIYSAADTTLVGAIHDWFDAQVSDHGSHAQAHR